MYVSYLLASYICMYGCMYNVLTTFIYIHSILIYPVLIIFILFFVENFCSFETSYLYWGEYEDVLSCNPEKFDVIFAADVIYEECQVDPLMDTVAALLKGN